MFEPHLSPVAELLAAWRSCRDPELADALDRHAATTAKPLVTRSKAELEVQWHALAAGADPQHLDSLLCTPWPRAWKDAMRRVRALAAFGVDPRVSSALVRVIATFPSFASAPLHGELAVRIRHIRDPRATQGLELAATGREGWTHDLYLEVAAFCALPPEPPPAAALAHARSILAAAADLGTLWEAVWANPADRSPRAILADALQGIGDPLGEFIALQLAEADGTSSPATRRRVKSLIENHGDTWTGPLPGVNRPSRVFERGFLTAVHLEPRMPGELEAAIHEPVFRLLERLGYRGDSEELAGVLPRMASLHTLASSYADTLLDLGVFPGIHTVGQLDDPRRDPRPTFPDLKWATYASRQDFGAWSEGLFARCADGIEPTLVHLSDAALDTWLQWLQNPPGPIRLEMVDYGTGADRDRTTVIRLDPGGRAAFESTGKRVRPENPARWTGLLGKHGWKLA